MLKHVSSTRITTIGAAFHSQPTPVRDTQCGPESTEQHGMPALDHNHSEVPYDFSSGPFAEYNGEPALKRHKVSELAEVVSNSSPRPSNASNFLFYPSPLNFGDLESLTSGYSEGVYQEPVSLPPSEKSPFRPRYSYNAQHIEAHMACSPSKSPLDAFDVATILSDDSETEEKDYFSDMNTPWSPQDYHFLPTSGHLCAPGDFETVAPLHSGWGLPTTLTELVSMNCM
jgi:hypothetical protein